MTSAGEIRAVRVAIPRPFEDICECDPLGRPSNLENIACGTGCEAFSQTAILQFAFRSIK